MPNPELLEEKCVVITSDVPTIPYVHQGRSVNCFDLFPEAQKTWTVPIGDRQSFQPPRVFHYDAIQETQVLAEPGKDVELLLDYRLNKRLDLFSNLFEYNHYDVVVRIDIRVPLGATARFKVYARPYDTEATDGEWANYPGVVFTTDEDATHYFMVKWSNSDYVASTRNPYTFATVVLHTIEINYTKTVPVPIYFTPTINIVNPTFYVIRNNIVATKLAGEVDPARVLKLAAIPGGKTRAGWIWGILETMAGLAADFLLPGWGPVISAGASFVIKVVEKLVSRDGGVSKGQAHGLAFTRGTSFAIRSAEMGGKQYFTIVTSNKEYFLVNEADQLIPYQNPSEGAVLPIHSIALPSPEVYRAVAVSQVRTDVVPLNLYTGEVSRRAYITRVSATNFGVSGATWPFTTLGTDEPVGNIGMGGDGILKFWYKTGDRRYNQVLRPLSVDTGKFIGDTRFGLRVKPIDSIRLMLVVNPDLFNGSAFVAIQPSDWPDSAHPNDWKDIPNGESVLTLAIPNGTGEDGVVTLTKTVVGQQFTNQWNYNSKYIFLLYNGIPSPTNLCYDPSIDLSYYGKADGIKHYDPYVLDADEETYGMAVTIPHKNPPTWLIEQGPDDDEGTALPSDTIDTHKVVPQRYSDPQVAPLGVVSVDVTARAVWVPIQTFTQQPKTMRLFKVGPYQWGTSGSKTPSQAQLDAMRHVYVGPSGDGKFVEYRLTSSANAFANGRLLVVHIPPAIPPEEIEKMSIEELSQFNRTEHILRGPDSTLSVQWMVPLPYIKAYDADEHNGHIVVAWVERTIGADNNEPQFTMWVRAEIPRYSIVRPPVAYVPIAVSSRAIPQARILRGLRLRNRPRHSGQFSDLALRLREAVETNHPEALRIMVGCAAMFSPEMIRDLFEEESLEDLAESWDRQIR